MEGWSLVRTVSAMRSPPQAIALYSALYPLTWYHWLKLMEITVAQIGWVNNNVKQETLY